MSEECAIRDLHTTWIQAVNAGDLDRLLGLMADDAVFLNPGRAPAGRNDFPAGFSQAHRENQIRCASTLQDVTVSGDVAYTWSKDSLDLAPRKDGKAIRLEGHRLTIYRKQPDGRWLLSRDAHTLSVV